MRHLTGETTTDKLLLGDAEFKMIPARPQQTTPSFAQDVPPSRRPLYCLLSTLSSTLQTTPFAAQGVPPRSLSPRHSALVLHHSSVGTSLEVRRCNNRMRIRLPASWAVGT
jgi:hypothetical protein